MTLVPSRRVSQMTCCPGRPAVLTGSFAPNTGSCVPLSPGPQGAHPHSLVGIPFRVTHRARASASRPFPGLKRTAASETPAGRIKGESGACARPNHIHDKTLELASVTAPAGVACPSFSIKLRERGERETVFGMQRPSGCRLGPVYHVAAAAERTLSAAGMGNATALQRSISGHVHKGPA